MNRVRAKLVQYPDRQVEKQAKGEVSTIGWHIPEQAERKEMQAVSLTQTAVAVVTGYYFVVCALLQGELLPFIRKIQRKKLTGRAEQSNIASSL